MADQIKFIGTLKGVNTKSKETDDGGEKHTIELKLEISDGKDRVQDVIECLKDIVEISILSKQPKLINNQRPYKDD